jgi:hypothetical protein
MSRTASRLWAEQGKRFSLPTETGHRADRAHHRAASLPRQERARGGAVRLAARPNLMTSGAADAGAPGAYSSFRRAAPQDDVPSEPVTITK